MSMEWDGDGDRDEIMKRRFKETVAVVEATSTEVQDLWATWSNESDWQNTRYTHRKVKWVQVSPGYIETIGQIGKGKDAMPVAISLTWNRIDGQLVLFWELTSMVQDYRMVDPWLTKHFPKGKWPTHDHGRISRSDAMNFGNMMYAVDEANGKKL